MRTAGSNIALWCRCRFVSSGDWLFCSRPFLHGPPWCRPYFTTQPSLFFGPKSRPVLTLPLGCYGEGDEHLRSTLWIYRDKDTNVCGDNWMDGGKSIEGGGCWRGRSLPQQVAHMQKSCIGWLPYHSQVSNMQNLYRTSVYSLDGYHIQSTTSGRHANIKYDMCNFLSSLDEYKYMHFVQWITNTILQEPCAMLQQMITTWWPQRWVFLPSWPWSRHEASGGARGAPAPPTAAGLVKFLVFFF